MSLMIDVDKVSEVLLPDGKWYDVVPFDDGRSTFDLDAYEFVQYSPKEEWEQEQKFLSLGPAGTGAVFHVDLQFDEEGPQKLWDKVVKEVGTPFRIACPISSVMAVKYHVDEMEEDDE